MTPEESMLMQLTEETASELQKLKTSIRELYGIQLEGGISDSQPQLHDVIQKIIYMNADMFETVSKLNTGVQNVIKQQQQSTAENAVRSVFLNPHMDAAAIILTFYSSCNNHHRISLIENVELSLGHKPYVWCQKLNGHANFIFNMDKLAPDSTRTPWVGDPTYSWNDRDRFMNGPLQGIIEGCNEWHLADISLRPKYAAFGDCDCLVQIWCDPQYTRS